MAGNQQDTEEYKKAREATYPKFESNLPGAVGIPKRSLVPGQTQIGDKKVDVELNTRTYDVTNLRGVLEPQVGGPIVDIFNFIGGFAAETQAGSGIQAGIIEGLRRVSPKSNVRTGENPVIPPSRQVADALGYALQRHIPLIRQISEIVNPKDRDRAFAMARMFLPLEAVDLVRGYKGKAIETSGLKNRVRTAILSDLNKLNRKEITRDQYEKRVAETLTLMVSAQEGNMQALKAISEGIKYTETARK